MISLERYVKTKDRYCISYVGNCEEYIVQLLYLRPAIEKKYHGLKIDIAIKNGLNYSGTISQDELKANKIDYVYIHNLAYDMKDHPVERLLDDSDIRVVFANDKPSGKTCCILSEGHFPTISLTELQIAAIKMKFVTKGYDVYVNTCWDQCGLLIGVENKLFYEGVFNGKAGILINTGVGANFFKKIFPNCGILQA